MSVEARLSVVEEKLDKLMTNEIPHMNEKIGRIETNMSWLIKLSSLILATVLIGMVEIFFVK